MDSNGASVRTPLDQGPGWEGRRGGHCKAGATERGQTLNGKCEEYLDQLISFSFSDVRMHESDRR